MAKFAQKFVSAKQEWETPSIFFDKLNEEFEFTIDLAANSTNTKCVSFFSKEQDAMDQDWHGICWLNPPYGSSGKYKLSEWIKKGFNESQKHNSTIVILIPARTNTNWWHNYCMKSKEIKLVKGRPKFGGAKYGLPQPLAIIVFKKTDSPIVISTFEAENGL